MVTVEGRRDNALYRNLAIILLVGWVFLPIRKGYALTDESLAVRIIIAEGANQGLEGMTAIAEVVRRRGADAFSCLKRKDLESFIARQPVWVHTQARKAWAMSSTSNLTLGATHYEAVETFGRPKWAKGMRRTVKIKDHTFFIRQH